jgi:DNA mismatch endonuclease (patch repair protein)
MEKVRGKGNKSTEGRLRFALVGAGIHGWKLRPKDITGCPDFYFKKERLVVFVDGCFWHGCSKCGHVPKTNSTFWKTKLERNRMRDRRHTRLLKEQGIVVIRFWEHELRESSMNCVKKLITGLVQGKEK